MTLAFANLSMSDDAVGKVSAPKMMELSESESLKVSNDSLCCGENLLVVS